MTSTSLLTAEIARLRGVIRDAAGLIAGLARRTGDPDAVDAAMILHWALAEGEDLPEGLTLTPGGTIEGAPKHRKRSMPPPIILATALGASVAVGLVVGGIAWAFDDREAAIQFGSFMAAVAFIIACVVLYHAAAIDDWDGPFKPPVAGIQPQGVDRAEEDRRG